MPSAVPSAEPSAGLNDEQLLRYSRHILLDAVGVEGQQRLLAAHALVLGAGGLGSPVALYLASAGVGRITLIDDDRVDLTNLQRQIAHNLERVGQLKVESARCAMHALNPQLRIEAIAQRADAALLERLAPQADVLIDCSDNFATRHLLNRASVRYRVPLVAGAALRFDGQVAVFDPRAARAPCYACVFPEAQAPSATLCATMGVWAPLVGLVGTLQASEALKLLTNVGQPLRAQMLLIDGLGSRFTALKLAQDPNCLVCGGAPQPSPAA